MNKIINILGNIGGIAFLINAILQYAHYRARKNKSAEVLNLVNELLEDLLDELEETD